MTLESNSREATTVFADAVMAWMADLGYTTCFCVAGGNSMHLLRAASERFRVIPFVHEVTAGIAAEHFNLIDSSNKAFVLVTTGPGLTNLMTPVASSWVENRPLVVLCGAVKTADLKRGSGLRQRGIQELSAKELFSNFSKEVYELHSLCTENEFKKAIAKAHRGRNGPVVVEVPIDVQGYSIPPVAFSRVSAPEEPSADRASGAFRQMPKILDELQSSSRPSLLIGGGVNREFFRASLPKLQALGIPIFTSWNSADYLGPWSSLYAGRPDNFGQRSANILVNQSDFLLAVGTRLGLQLTGFNWSSFATGARIVHVEIDESELQKGHPNTHYRVPLEGSVFLTELFIRLEGWSGPVEWVEYCARVRQELAGHWDSGEESSVRMSPQNVVSVLQEVAPHDAVFIPSSSGNAEIAVMQGLEVSANQRLIVSEGLASMGYGLPGAIGSALANPTTTVFCIEGDGSLAQSIADLSTVVGRKLNIVLIVLDNSGYGSIRATQKRFLGPVSLGTDSASGLHLPDLTTMALGLGFEVRQPRSVADLRRCLRSAFEQGGPHLVSVKLDSRSPALPRVSSDLHDDGNLVSNPTWDMNPPLPKWLVEVVGQFLPIGKC